MVFKIGIDISKITLTLTEKALCLVNYVDDLLLSFLEFSW